MFEPIGLGRGIEFELHPPGAILEPGDVDQHRRALARGTSSSVGAERGCGVRGDRQRKRSGKESGNRAVHIDILVKERAPQAAISAARTMRRRGRSEEHTSELQSLTRISYSVLCLKKKNVSRSIFCH